MVEVDTNHERLNKIPVPDKINIKSKILHIHNPKFNSLKPEKSPEKMISNYKNMSKNIKKKPINSANTTTKNNTSASTSHGPSTPASKHTFKSHNSFNKNQKTSYQDLTNSPTIRSDNVVMSENSDYNDNSNNNNIVLKPLAMENFLPVIEVDFSDKILNLVEKISNFLLVSCEEQNFIYNQNSNCFIKKQNVVELDEIEIFNPKNSHNRKNMSANFEKVFVDSLISQKEYEMNKYDMFYHEMESIYDMSVELKDSVKFPDNNNLRENERRSEESIRLPTQALLNIEMIKDYSDVRMSTYKRLLASCNNNFKEISEEILKTMSKMKFEEKKVANYFNLDPYDDNIPPKKESLKGNNTPDTATGSGGKDKNSLINEKLEMLRHLKEKKDQILNENQSQKDKIKRNTKHNKTIKLKNIDRTMTEIDPSESFLNENVVVNYLPQSNINNVNKPREENMHYKNCFEEIEIEEEEGENKGNSMDESNIVINFDDCLEFQNPPEVVKQPNDTLLQTGTDFMKSHKRSRSEINYSAIHSSQTHNQSQIAEKQ